ncbi:eukaryotic translation initiation factor 4E [Neoconidiobolus thromboides FSU 785]|nr:eukaryotic translation initiation factor 4E [Neoconidiobolus thromboides FSU 785]
MSLSIDQKEENPILEQVAAEAEVVNQESGEEGAENEGEDKQEFLTIFNDPVNYNVKHPLQESWTFWYDSQNSKPAQKDWSQNLKPLITFRTVEDFWGAYNNITKVSELSVGSNFHIFREGIRPAWEDPANAKGGRWTVQFNKKQAHGINHYFLYSILMCIGESSPHSEQVCGIVVSVRKAFYRLSLWTRDSHQKDELLDIGRHLRASIELPAGDTLEFQPHEDATKSGIDRLGRLIA